MDPDKAEPAGWQYKPKTEPASNYETAHPVAPAARKAAAGAASWTAAEYIAHDHPAGWYLGLAVLTVGLAAVMYLLTRDYFATISVVVVGGIVGAYAGRKPQQITYELTEAGLKIGDKDYPYSTFQSFSLIAETGAASVSLTPLKRFMPPISIYFPADQQAKIVEVLGSHLPHDQRQLDAVERLTRRLRF